MDIINTTFQDIITTFLLNKMLHHVGILWIIKTNQRFKYDMDKHNSDYITGGPWYNTSNCKEVYGNLFGEFIRNARTDRYNIMYSIGAHEKIIHQNMMVEAALLVIHYHQIQQQKH